MLKSIAFACILLISTTALASETDTTPFPPGTKMMPAKKMQLILEGGKIKEMDYPSRPCVMDNVVNMIPGENILIECEVKSGMLVNMRQVDKVVHKDRTIELEFKQLTEDKQTFMLLKIMNPFDEYLSYNATIQYPDQKPFYKTSSLPVYPKTGNYESWPDPIARIVLKDFQLKSKPVILPASKELGRGNPVK